MLDVGLSSTDRIAAFFGIAPEPAERTEPRARRASRPASPRARAKTQAEPASGVQAAIENALKAAGLMGAEARHARLNRAGSGSLSARTPLKERPYARQEPGRYRRENARQGFRILSTRTDGGAIASRPMSNNREVDFDGDAWFFTFDDARMVADIAPIRGVGLAYQGKAGSLAFGPSSSRSRPRRT